MRQASDIFFQSKQLKTTVDQTKIDKHKYVKTAIRVF